MQTSGWIQFALYFVALALITKPMGLYLLQVLDAERQNVARSGAPPAGARDLSRHGRGSEQGARLEAIHPRHAALQPGGCLFTYAILRLQHFLPLNPQGLGRESARIWRSTPRSVSPPTPTGRATAANPRMSYFSQMVGLAFHNFARAATGIAIAAALVRGIARHSANTIGNFWVDLVRVTYYLLLPICLVFAVFLVSQGMIQNFKPYTKAKLDRADESLRSKRRTTKAKRSMALTASR